MCSIQPPDEHVKTGIFYFKEAPLLMLQILVSSKPNLVANFSHSGSDVTLSMILISLPSLNFRTSRLCSFGLSPIGFQREREVERERGRGREGEEERGRGRERGREREQVEINDSFPI